MMHSSHTEGHADFNTALTSNQICDMFNGKAGNPQQRPSLRRLLAYIEVEGITSSLTRTQSWLWTLPLLYVWLIHLQIRTGGITVRDRGKSSDIHKPFSRADTLTFILLSMTVLFLSLFHLLLLPIIASSPVSVLHVWSTLSRSTPPQENKSKSVKIRAWSESDTGNNESQELSMFFHSYSRLNPERCVGPECGRRKEVWKRWKQALSRKKGGREASI